MTDDEAETARQQRARVGLCFDCRYARRLSNARGNDFYRCERAAVDPSLCDYPQLPVFQCDAFALGAPRRTR